MYSHVTPIYFVLSHLENDGFSEEDSTGESVGSESEVSQMDTSLYIPTPDHYLHQVWEMSKQKVKHPCNIVDKVNFTSVPQVTFMDSSKLDEFVKALNQVCGCKTPGYERQLPPVQVHSIGLGCALCSLCL